MTINSEKELDHSQNERFWDSINQHTQIALCKLSISGRFLKVSKKFCQILSYTEREFEDMTLQDICDYNEDDKLFKEETYSFEKRVLTKLGTYTWLRFNLSREYSHNGKPYSYFAFVEDISEYKKMEEELYNANKVIDSIFNTSSAMIAYLDRDFNFIRVNESYARAGGHDIEFYIGKNHFDLYPYEGNEMIFRSVVETGEPISYQDKQFEYKEYPELGVTYWDWDLVPVKHACGKVMGLIFSLVDVTKRKNAEDRLIKANEQLENRIIKRTAELQYEIEQRKKAEEELSRNEQCYREIVEYTSNGLVLVDVVSEDCFRIVTTNPSVNRILGLDNSLSTGKYIDEVLVKKVSKDILKKYKRCIKLDKILSYEEYYVVDNETRFYNTTFIPIKDQEGKIYRILGVFRDITEYKKLSESLKLGKERAEQDSNDKSEYIANMSHELRTPLNVILSALQLFDSYIEYDPTNESHKHFRHIKTVKQNALRLLRLVNNLIDTTKIDSNFYELNLANYDIVKVIEIITHSVTDYVKYKNIELKYSSNIDKRIIACDLNIIERIMLNLLSNAIKFTDKNGIIQVDVTDKENEVYISVIDNGIGIPEDRQHNIFDRYKQVDNLLTRKHEGSGIGLSLVKSFVELLGGRISVSSEPGNGSKFTVVLPSKIIETNKDRADVDCSLGDYGIVQKTTVELSDIYFKF